MRIVVLILFSIVASGDGVASAQGAVESGAPGGDSRRQESPEEVIVRGRRLGDLRFEVQVAREYAFNVFNEINSSDDFDVYCREEAGRTGTRANRPRVCRAQFENRISADAADEYLSTVARLCQPDGTGFLDTQACMFSSPGATALSNAQGVESELPSKRDQMTEEIFRLAREDDRFAQAILDWYEANQQYEAARKRRDD